MANKADSKSVLRACRRGLVRLVLRGLLARADRKLVDAGGLRVSDTRRVLVLRPNHRLGNQVLITALLAELELRFPDARVDVLSGSFATQLLAGFPRVADVYALPDHAARYPVRMVGLVWRLRRARYDLVVDCGGDSQSSRLLIAWLDPRHAVAAVDPARSRQRRLPSPARAPSHMAQAPVFLLRVALGVRGQREYPLLNVRLTAAERQAGLQVIRSFVGDAGRDMPVLGIFGYATANKSFACEWWQRLCAHVLAARPARLVEILPPGKPSCLDGRFPTYRTEDLRQLASVLSAMSCFVSADCGVMHLAAASGTTVLGLFCVTPPAMYAPYGNGSRGIDVNTKEPEAVARDVIDALAGAAESRGAANGVRDIWPPALAGSVLYGSDEAAAPDDDMLVMRS